MDSQEFVERNILLLLAQDEKGLSPIHLQKEMFIFSRISKDLEEDLNFEKHYYGPYSRVLEETIVSPTYLSDIFEFSNKVVRLSEKGKKEYKKMLNDRKDDLHFNLLLTSLKVIRRIYDSLSNLELLFLIYVSYPEYKKNSSLAPDLFNSSIKGKLLESLRRKDIITNKRYEELKNE